MKQYVPVDGVDRAPAPGEVWDNLVFLPRVDRLAVMGGNAYPGESLQYFREDGVTRTGPYFFDPDKADPNKVGGTTGSQVRPDLFPTVVGGEMWENRQSIQTSAGLVGPISQSGGVTAYAEIDGKDVVFVGERGASRQGRLFSYTVNSLTPGDDTWALVGVMGQATFDGAGAGAYDPKRNAFVRVSSSALMYWDLEASGPTNMVRYFTPTVLGESAFSVKGGRFGLDYDTTLDVFYMWRGGSDVWVLDPPDTLQQQGWTVTQVLPTGSGPRIPDRWQAGVYGRWNYLPDLGVFLGLEAKTNDVWIFKPNGGLYGASGASGASVPLSVSEPGLAVLMGLGVLFATFSGSIRRHPRRQTTFGSTVLRR
ncbi:MAG: hypothetical protein MUF48_21230 [Pirellulaceae bacterium]|jgi:hypothetical protein|nr:hypothetical protein [Pirellulaceae bacterium]